MNISNFFIKKRKILPQYKSDIISAVEFIRHVTEGKDGLGKLEALDKFHFIDRLTNQTDIKSEQMYLEGIRAGLFRILVENFRISPYRLIIVIHRRKFYPITDNLHPDYEEQKE